jgi:uncharacterized protein
MTERDWEIVRKLKRGFSERVSVVDMRVFGSRARGDNAPSADLDVFIEVERLDRAIRRIIQDTAWEIGLDYEMVIAPVIFSRHEVEETPVRSSSLLSSVRAEGIVV